jgi:hypothetical protein
MSQRDLALAASQRTQQQIAALGGTVPNLAAASATAEAQALKEVIERATTAAVGVLQGANAKASGLVAAGNDLERQVAKNKKEQSDLARARAFYTETQNIFPLQKLIGIPTAKDVLAEFPDIDKIPDNWTPTTPAAPAAASAS